MALTGLLLGSFLLVHAAGNSLIFQGQAAFTAYAAHLRSFRLLLPAAGLSLLAVLLVHILTGISLFLRNRKAKGGRYAVSHTAPLSWAARTMPLTGTANLAFLLLHLATVRFADQAVPVAERLARVLADPILALLYAVGIASLTMHIAHGFWSLTQSLGLNHLRWNGLIRGCAALAAGLTAGIFFGIILLHRY